MERNELHEIVANYGYVVFVSEEFDSLITWNGSATLLFWAPLAEDARSGEWLAGGYRRPKAWTNTDIQTDYELDTVNKAERAAREWHENLLIHTHE